MLVLYLMYENGEVKKFCYCTMEAVLETMKREKKNGAIKYKIEEFD